MYPATQTFWLERTDQVAVGLRRYTHGKDGFDCVHGHHHALVYTGLEPADYGPDGYLAVRPMVENDPRWPTHCAQGCGYEFVDDDTWQMWQEQVCRRTDTDELRVLHQGAPAPEAPAAEPGASWDAWWMPFNKGPDGMTLMVRCPNGRDWMVDSRASNCTMPDDDVHRCWVRHGDPRECKVTVDKNGLTCSAGAGSIQAGDYHGFLQAGVLTAG